MEKKVYIVFVEKVYDYDLLEQEVYPYESGEKALKAFNKFVKKEKAWLKEYEPYWEVEEDETMFEAYDEGSFSQYHTTMWIKEMEVK